MHGVGPFLLGHFRAMAETGEREQTRLARNAARIDLTADGAGGLATLLAYGAIGLLLWSGSMDLAVAGTAVLAIRAGASSLDILVLQMAELHQESLHVGTVYAAGLRHAPSGHLDGPHEDVGTAVIREAAEETGVRIEAAAVRLAVTVHHRGPRGKARIGLFFEARTWQGVPEVREPDVCDAYRAGLPGAVHFQEPGDPVRHRADVPDRIRRLPGPARTPGTPTRREAPHP